MRTNQGPEWCARAHPKATGLPMMEIEGNAAA